MLLYAGDQTVVLEVGAHTFIWGKKVPGRNLTDELRAYIADTNGSVRRLFYLLYGTLDYSMVHLTILWYTRLFYDTLDYSSSGLTSLTPKRIGEKTILWYTRLFYLRTYIADTNGSVSDRQLYRIVYA